MAVHGIDLLISRRRANVSAQAIAVQMGVTRQYVSKLETRADVTPEAAESYRRALSALEADRRTVTIEVDTYADLDYAKTGRKVRALMREHPPGKTLYNVVLTEGTPYQPLLAVLDSIVAIGADSRVIIAGGEGEPTVLKRVG